MSGETISPPRMGPIDAMFWRLEGERSLRSTTMAIALLDASPDRQRLRAVLERAALRIPRVRQRVLELPTALSTPIWTRDPDFDLDYHLRWIAAPGDGELQPLLDLAASMAMQSFDRARPLWEFVVVEGLAGGRAALIQKLHHSVGDGAAGLALMAEIYDTEPNPVRDAGNDAHIEADCEPIVDGAALRTEALQSAMAEGPRNLLRLLRGGIAAMEDPAASVRELFDELRAVSGIMRSGPGPFSPIMSERSSRRRFAFFRIPEAPLKRAASEQGCKFNDAFLSALVGGLALYHQRRNATVDALRAAIPVNMRSADAVAASGNRLSIAQFEAPLTDKDPASRMRTVRSLLRNQREPASLAAFEVIANMVNLLPLSFILPLVLEEMQKSDFVATAIPGPAANFYMAGSRVESLIPFGPTAGAALNVTLLSYSGHAHIALTMDAAAVPDQDLLVECLQKGFEEVMKLSEFGDRSTATVGINSPVVCENSADEKAE